MKFSTLEELKVRKWEVFGRLFESVRRQVGQNWPVQDFRGFIFSVPKTLPDNLIQRGVMALSERTHVLARLSPAGTKDVPVVCWPPPRPGSVISCRNEGC